MMNARALYPRPQRRAHHEAHPREGARRSRPARGLPDRGPGQGRVAHPGAPLRGADLRERRPGRLRRHLHGPAGADADGGPPHRGAGGAPRSREAGHHRRARGRGRARAEPAAHQRARLRRADLPSDRRRVPHQGGRGHDPQRSRADGGDRPQDRQDHPLRDEILRRRARRSSISTGRAATTRTG